MNDQFFIMQKKIGWTCNVQCFKYSGNVTYLQQPRKRKHKEDMKQKRLRSNEGQRQKLSLQAKPGKKSTSWTRYNKI